MKKVFEYSILAIMVLASCQVEELEKEKPEVLAAQNSKPFIAIIEDDGIGSETRTTLDNSGNVLWKQGDQVSIFSGSTVNERYQVTDESEGKTSAALNKIPDDGFVFGTNIDNNVAFYPYASTATIAKSGSNYVISGINLPATQNYAVDSFGNGAFPMAAITSSTEEMNLTFKNVLGGLKLQLTGTATIASITMTGNNDEILCGDAGVTVSSNNAPSINLTDDSAKTVTLDCGAGVALDAETATTFIIALPPMALNGGFTVVVTDTGGKKMEIKTTRSQTIARSRLLKMPVVTYEESLPKKALLPYEFLPNEIDKTTITEAYFHVFNPTTTEIVISAGDNEFEPIYFEMVGTVAHFYTNGQVYKSYGPHFEGWKSLRSLDLSMFDISDAQDLGQAFMDCHSLQSLNLSSFDTSNVLYFSNMFNNCVNLRTLDVTNFDTSRADGMYGMFENCKSLTSLDVSSFNTASVTNFNRMFASCSGLKQLDLSGFDTSRTTELTELFAGCTSLESINLSSFNTSNVRTTWALFADCWNLRTIDLSFLHDAPLEIVSSMFSNCRSLVYVDLSNLDLSKVIGFDGLFNMCSSLKSIKLPTTSITKVQWMQYMFDGCASLEEIDLSSFETSNLTEMRQAFHHCTSLKSLNLSHFDTKNVKNMNYLFSGCSNLEHLDISGFDSSHLTEAYSIFFNTHKLTYLDLGGFNLENVTIDDAAKWFGDYSSHCHIRCTNETKNILINNASWLSKDKYIWYTDGSQLPNVQYEPEEGLYCSTDYSKDKTVRTVQLAQEGAGIDLVLMGDAYSDRLIASGKYDADMERAINAIFAVEPFKSFKHLFNIYIVYAVSENEIIGKATALDCFNNSSPIGSPSWAWESYYLCAAKNATPGECSPVIIMNSTISDGAASGFLGSTTGDYMNDPNRDDYHGGFSEAVAYISGPDDDRFDYTVRHEFGHSFGFLMDEYSNYSYSIPEWEITSWQLCFAYGMWRNVDLVSDDSVKWAKFIHDSRYSGTGIGVFEGALYATGAWRSTQESIMNSTDSGFNAPSREAIFYRIHKLAYGKDWDYNYEDFVTYDWANIEADKARMSAPKHRMKRATSSFKREPVLKKSIDIGPDGKERIKIEMN